MAGYRFLISDWQKSNRPERQARTAPPSPFSSRPAPSCKGFRLDVTTGKRIAITQFNPRDPVGLEGVRGLRITPGGKFGAYSYIRALSEVYLVRNFQFLPTPQH